MICMEEDFLSLFHMEEINFVFSKLGKVEI